MLVITHFFFAKRLAPFRNNCYNILNWQEGCAVMKLQFVEAGEIVSTHGVRGEFKVLPWSDGPEFLLDFKRVQISGKEYSVESCRVQKTCNLMKLKGVESVDEAMALRGKVVNVYRSEISDDVIFAAELIGVEVYTDDVQIGEIVDVLDYPGNKVYVVRGEYEYMIPAVKQFVLNTDMENNKMYVQLIEGMRTDEN